VCHAEQYMPLLRHIDGRLIVSVKTRTKGLTLKSCQGFLQSSQPNPRQAPVLDCSFLRALSKHIAVEFGLKTIRMEKVQRSPLDCPCKPLTSI